jgi:hypothetical protein
VVVVEFLVAVPEPCLRKAPRQDTRAVVDVVLVAPALFEGFAGFGVERDAEIDRRARMVI